MPTRILVADDHPLYREAVRLRLERLLPDCSVVEAGSLDEVLAAIKTAPGSAFDLILLDIHLSDGDPGANAERVIGAAPDTPVILMSGTASSDVVRQAIARGARGFVPKTMQSELFATALSMVLGGGSYLPVEILQESPAVASETAVPRVDKKFDDILTAREKQVLVLVATGASNKEIGRELNLAEVTIKLHVRQILRKIGARNRSEAASIATRAALL
ncbi:MAG TPA: response regulator transcription factor [Stellaceae bacterium]|jgi:DNA-binding NarL/FixJ family response regulator|nr:response regulator transcription factor [Stellaceae bacterium]